MGGYLAPVTHPEKCFLLINNSPHGLNKEIKYMLLLPSFYFCFSMHLWYHFLLPFKEFAYMNNIFIELY